jgi:hypothetical protein
MIRIRPTVPFSLPSAPLLSVQHQPLSFGLATAPDYVHFPYRQFDNAIRGQNHLEPFRALTSSREKA